MTQGEAIGVLSDALLTGLKIAAPILIVSVLVGLVISVIQAATQVNEQTITLVPKILAIAFVLIFLGSWMLNTMVDFVNRTISNMLSLII
ncbi:MAG: flagellar biosynthesis protein FliQ [Oscillospiraceae bacterium]|jgi:flagellar biosynthetic protein FliQ|nr:flagellar biosynthesis protein FliQ [Oscillospiraceae bacterium]